jgi:16S rRNA (uracil1498-N3)-methyltransferase
LFWIFLEEQQLSVNPVQITGQKAHHLARVLRVRPGELGVAVSSGREYALQVDAVKSSLVTASVRGVQPAGGELPLRLTLLQALLPNPDFDRVLEAGTALGVIRFVPVLASRSVARPAPERLQRWRSIVESAAEQSHRGAVPQVEAPLGLAEAVAQTSSSRLLVLDPRASMSLRDAAGNHTVYALAIGPEGGWTEDERSILSHVGGVPVSLGARILRARLAPIVAAAILIDHVAGMTRQ